MEVLADEESSSGRYNFQKVADGGIQVAEWSRWLGSVMWRISRWSSRRSVVPCSSWSGAGSAASQVRVSS